MQVLEYAHSYSGTAWIQLKWGPSYNQGTEQMGVYIRSTIHTVIIIFTIYGIWYGILIYITGLTPSDICLPYFLQFSL